MSTRRTPTTGAPSSRTSTPNVDVSYDKGAAQAAALTALGNMFDDHHFAALTLKSGEMERKVHKSVMCATSKWFARSCKGPFKEGKGKFIELLEDHKGTVAAMIQFCYQFIYDEPTEAPMTFHYRMFAIADKYEVAGLQALAARKFELSTTAKWDVMDFVVAVKETYEEDRKGPFKQMIAEVSAEHSEELFGSATTTGNVSFGEIADSLPGYATDVLRETNNNEKRKKDKATRRYRCILSSSCRGHFTVDRPMTKTDYNTPSYYDCNSCFMRYCFKDCGEWEAHRI